MSQKIEDSETKKMTIEKFFESKGIDPSERKTRGKIFNQADDAVRSGKGSGNGDLTEGYAIIDSAQVVRTPEYLEKERALYTAYVEQVQPHGVSVPQNSQESKQLNFEKGFTEFAKTKHINQMSTNFDIAEGLARKANQAVEKGGGDISLGQKVISDGLASYGANGEQVKEGVALYKEYVDFAHPFDHTANSSAPQARAAPVEAPRSSSQKQPLHEHQSDISQFLAENGIGVDSPMHKPAEALFKIADEFAMARGGDIQKGLISIKDTLNGVIVPGHLREMVNKMAPELFTKLRTEHPYPPGLVNTKGVNSMGPDQHPDVASHDPFGAMVTDLGAAPASTLERKPEPLPHTAASAPAMASCHGLSVPAHPHHGHDIGTLSQETAKITAAEPEAPAQEPAQTEATVAETSTPPQGGPFDLHNNINMSRSRPPPP
ncbi:MAG: hypothetical protein WC654_07890, partial [Patescibacteria group bacterium]